MKKHRPPPAFQNPLILVAAAPARFEPEKEPPSAEVQAYVDRMYAANPELVEALDDTLLSLASPLPPFGPSAPSLDPLPHLLSPVVELTRTCSA